MVNNYVATTSYGYDAAGRLTDLDHTQGTSTLAFYDWDYDAAGRLTAFTSVDGMASYSYDKTDQLTAADYDYQGDESYAYDANGNRTNTGYVTGTDNRLLESQSHTYTYDAEGNRTKATEKATGDYVTYAWNHRNQSVEVAFHAAGGSLAKRVELDYDALGRLIRKRVDETGDGSFDRAEKYVYDQAGKFDPATGMAIDDVVLVFDDSGSLTSRLLHGPAIDQLFAHEDALGEILWALSDRQNSVREWAGHDAATGTTSIAGSATFDAFGNITATTGEVPIAVWAGYWWDADLKLFGTPTRMYEAATARFLGEDWIGFDAGQMNLTVYVGNSPTNYTDPSGLEPPNGYLRDPSLITTGGTPLSYMRCAICHGHPAHGWVHIAAFPELSGSMPESQAQALELLLSGVQSEPVSSKPSLGLEEQALLLDVAQFGLDIVGIFEPTPFCDIGSGLISLGRGDWLGVGVSVISIIPYVGDASKLAKIPKYVQKFDKAIRLARTNAAFAKQFRPIARRMAQTLDNVPLDCLPAGVGQQLEGLKKQLDEVPSAKGGKGGSGGSGSGTPGSGGGTPSDSTPGSGGGTPGNGTPSDGTPGDGTPGTPLNPPHYGIDLGRLQPTATVAGHAAQRPYINSPHTIQNIIESGTPRPDPGGVAGALRWDVPGSFRGSQGTFELVVDPATNRILHFLFRSGR